jgi:hypothetical protein
MAKRKAHSGTIEAVRAALDALQAAFMSPLARCPDGAAQWWGTVEAARLRVLESAVAYGDARARDAANPTR